MTLCDACFHHVKQRFVNQKPVVNIPEATLKQLSLEELEILETTVETGKTYCIECKQFCVQRAKYPTECTSQHFTNLKAYQHRILEDNQLLTRIRQEKQRRIVASRALSAWRKQQQQQQQQQTQREVVIGQYVFPAVPTKQPSNSYYTEKNQIS